MHNAFRLALACVTLLVVPFVTPVSGGVGAGNGEIGFDFGFTEFDSNTADDTGFRGVFRGGYHITDLFQIEGHLASSVSDEDIVDVTLTTLFVNGVFNFHPTNANIVPYVLGGIGVANVDFEVDIPFFGSIDVDDDSVAYQVAGGSRFFFGSNKRTAFRIELSVMGEDTFDESSTHINLVGGFTWRLGIAP